MNKLIAMTLLSIFCFTLNSCGFRNYLRNYTNIKTPRYAAGNVTTPNKNQNIKTLKVVSYNIEYARKIPEAIGLLREHKDLNNADVILLQEMDTEGVEKIAHALKYNYVYYPSVIHPIHKKDFGNAILSKWPILEDEKIILPNFNLRSRQRIAVGATLQINDKKVRVYSLHMAVFDKPSERKKRASVILENIPKDIDYCIVGGDFNTFTKKDHKEIFDSFKKSRFQHATHNIGWTSQHWYLLYRKVTLDHIYSKGMDITAAGKVINKKVSDHFPIWTKLSFKTKEKETYQITLKEIGK